MIDNYSVDRLIDRVMELEEQLKESDEEIEKLNSALTGISVIIEGIDDGYYSADDAVVSIKGILDNASG